MQQPQPVDLGVSSGGGTLEQQQEKPKKWLVWVLALVGVAAIVVIVVVLILTLGNSGGVTMDKVKAYCEKNNLEISEGTMDEPKGNYITCGVNNNTLQGASTEYTKIYLGSGVSADESGVSYYIIGQKNAMSLIASRPGG